ncbi:MAG: 4Fe-4S binding protein [Spirochaetales bacterium]|nr:4Fe-4S binding protein [Spirochaetales bacterium]
MLTMNNNSNYLRKELTSVLLRHFFNDRLAENIDRIPIDLNPKNDSSYRCCLYKDRAMTRYRILALLGISIEEDDDEFRSLRSFLDDAQKRIEITAPVLTVIDTACSSCVKVSYHVTDECKGCLARPCQTNCPVNAVTFINGRSIINKDLCRNCGKCKEVCPYNAIIYTPVPCEDSCPVGAVQRDDKGRMNIDYDKCIFCGKCSRSCPFGAVMERSQIIDVAGHIKTGGETVAILAPSVIGQFPGSLGQLAGALKKAGFTAVMEAAGGADRTAREEAAEFTHKMESGEPVMGTSCCPAYIAAVEKHVPVFKPFVSGTKTPMNFAAASASKMFPGAKKVFIGPCTAKKMEALRDRSADWVLTFEELGAIFIALDIDVDDCAEDEMLADGASFSSRAFPAIKGVSDAVGHYLSPEMKAIFNPLLVDGLSRKSLNLLKVAAAGKLKNNMIEVMSCEGGCICGPGIICNPRVTIKKLNSFLDRAG